MTLSSNTPHPAASPPDGSHRHAVTPLVRNVQLEHVEPGEILDVGAPRLSWRLIGGAPDFQQHCYEIEFASGGQSSTQRVESRESVLVAWPFQTMASRQNGVVRVRCQDRDGRWTAWSDACEVAVGLLESSDWSAQFVTPRTLGGFTDGAPHIFTTFELQEAPAAARLYISAHGIYEPYVNGVRVGKDIFAPGWTAYEKRLRYQSYDVTSHLGEGVNSLGAILGNGWFRGQLVWKGNRLNYGDRLALVAQLELEFPDGSRRMVLSDGSWSASPTGILSDDFYDGECRDMRLPLSIDAARSEPVDVLEEDHSRLVARRGPSVRATERKPAVSLMRSPSGRLQADFGQNLVGWVELVVRDRQRGDRIVVRHAEVLEGGELARRPLRSAEATCTYICAGVGEETLRPSFTYNGFRYIDIAGVDESDVVSVVAVVLGTDLRRIGWMTTSDPRLNRLHENVVWSARGNFLEVPTDCPQRDERLGWTGDIQLFAPTANYLFDSSGFLADWLEDVAAEQWADGSVPFIVPDVLREMRATAAGWGDAAVVVPMSLYLSFGDLGLLRRQYPSMRAWVDKVRALAGEDHIWTTGGPFGDWLDPLAPPDDPAQAQADPTVVSTAYFARSAQLLAEAASRLGLDSDARHYSTMAGEIRASFERQFVAEDGVVRSDCQTVYALALCGNLISDEGRRARAGERLVRLVLDADCTVATGLLGTAVILDALVIAGRPDVALRMLTQTRLPSWLYAVEMGATTMWERWDSMLPDGSVNPGEMTSFNHYANGAVADWMHRRIGGIAPTAPGYRRFEVRPLACFALDHGSARHTSPYGDIAVRWVREDATVELHVEVPHGTEADVWLPGGSGPIVVGPGQHGWSGLRESA
ncbi:family 78 glycoside hydrolase catalytic domain [Microbacterium aquimaris]|uniref:family 78 glycoside hydrolase catalytic domain n=1 Tax=Microbacterium aquimaris TaxID=459816 RepID=UPI002AD4DB7D|nr:family 78 glycoside hydrolase catalytic domain [Microbacterium aquimaris]MDZ8275746.1 family 78 glycoside hydrolase catalytic domain [Microbacterium aquimaris]